MRRLLPGPSRVLGLTAVLLGVDVLDELWSGMPGVGAPDIQRDFGLSYGQLSLILFSLPIAVSLAVEPVLFLLADRGSRRPLVCGGLALLGAALLLGASATAVWPFAIAALVAAPASGAGVTLSQATLMDADPARREQWMTRWTLMGALGDLLAPLVFGGLVLLGLGWRAGYALCGVLCLGYAVVLARRAFPAPSRAGEDEEEPGPWEALRRGLRHRTGLAWLAAVALCALLDEILVVFASLHLRDDLGFAPEERAGVLAAFAAGCAVGLVATERALRRIPHPRILRAAATLCAVCFALWIPSAGLPAKVGLGFGVGLGAGPLYPIAKAQAYRAFPGRSGLVNALEQLFLPFEIAVPFAFGALADATGPTVVLFLLLAQPLGVLFVSLRTKL